MTRRALFAALAGAVLDRERLLWVPGKKLISIPLDRSSELTPTWYFDRMNSALVHPARLLLELLPKIYGPPCPVLRLVAPPGWLLG